MNQWLDTMCIFTNTESWVAERHQKPYWANNTAVYWNT